MLSNLLCKTHLSRLTIVAFFMSFLFVAVASAASSESGLAAAQGQSSSASLRVKAVVGQSVSGINAAKLRQHAGRLFAVKHLELHSPNGGEVWTRDISYPVTWHKTPAVGDVKLQISTNAGLSYYNVTTGSISAAQFSWLVNTAPTSLALLRVSSASLPGLADISDAVFEIRTNSSVVLRPRLWLEGAMNGNNMRTDLQDRAYLPLSQPFASQPYSYGGTEQRSAAVDNVVDWLLIELRPGSNFNTTLLRRAALLLADGRVVDPSGADALLFDEDSLLPGNYYVVVHHRNHLGILSSAKLALGNGNTGTYDFRTARSQALRRFSSPQASLGTPGFGMYAGDLRPNGFINAADRVAARSRTFDVGYLLEDANLDGVVNAGDRVLARNNAFKVSNVP